MQHIVKEPDRHPNVFQTTIQSNKNPFVNSIYIKYTMAVTFSKAFTSLPANAYFIYGCILYTGHWH